MQKSIIADLEDLGSKVAKFDEDGDGVLTLQELVEGLAMYGFTPVQTRELFFGDDAQGIASAKTEISRQAFDKKVNHIRDVASTVVIVRTQHDGYNSGNSYHLGHALEEGLKGLSISGGVFI